MGWGMWSAVSSPSLFLTRVSQPCLWYKHVVFTGAIFRATVFDLLHESDPMCGCVCQLLSHVRLFGTPFTVAPQTPLSMEFSRQEYWSGLLFPSPDLSDPGIKPRSPALQADCLPLYHLRSPIRPHYKQPHFCMWKCFAVDVGGRMPSSFYVRIQEVPQLHSSRDRRSTSASEQILKVVPTAHIGHQGR